MKLGATKKSLLSESVNMRLSWQSKNARRKKLKKRLERSRKSKIASTNSKSRRTKRKKPPKF